MLAVQLDQPLNHGVLEVFQRPVVDYVVVGSYIVQRRFGWVRLLFQCERAYESSQLSYEPLTNNTEMHRIEPGVFDVVHFIRETAVGN